MTVIGGIPSWVQMYFENILKKTKKKNLAELFNEFNLYIYGGVNFLPYKNIFKKLIGKQIDTIEYYPASEGFLHIKTLNQINHCFYNIIQVFIMSL